MDRQPSWLTGLLDGLSASNLIRNSSIPHKNRLSLIILDSTLEIAFKKYLVHVLKIPNLDGSVWEHRPKLIKVVKSKISFETEVWEEIDEFYEIRRGFYHEESEKTIIDDAIDNFQETVEFVMDRLFNIKCSELLPLTQSLLPVQDVEGDNIPINKIRTLIDVIVVAIAESQSKNSYEIIDVLKKKGFRGKISSSVLSVYLNQKYKHLFYFEEYWKLSEEGVRRYADLRKSYLVQKTQDQK